MKLYLIRHGESEGNQLGVFSGWCQHNLTEKGKEDARKAGRIISKVKFDKVYSSDLYRAIDTAKIALPDHECESTPLLKEINVGLLQEMNYDEGREKYRHLYQKSNGNDFGEVGGESFSQLYQRLEVFLDMVASSSYENVAAFSHGGILRAVLRMVVGEAINTHNLDCPNCCISIFEYKNDRWILKTWNYTEEI